MSEDSAESTSPMHHAIARELGLEIIDGAWPLEAARTLEDLQSRFGVSRTVAREVSRQLEAMGLVRTRRRFGLVARPMSEWSVLNPLLIDWRLHSSRREEQIYSLTQLRLAVEPAAAESAARFASIHTRARLLPLAAEMRRTGEAGQLHEFMKFDIEFHSRLLKSCGNELFAALSDLVAVVLQGRTELGLMPAQPKPEALAGHEAVAEAVFRGDPEAARIAMQGILDEVREAFSEAEAARAAAS
ncbi:MAG TPA: FCD domain-containing protein [Propionicimonas sp.]|nr:FCD domain-containing protein [Propionicimonas sp.]HQA78491.1 FCD domain-containing protein [Propionicimonas sp.]HQD95823.1 FCD domain-containing protein [Propionicimonas sp.]